MIEFIRSVSPEVWTAIFTGISAFVIVCGSGLAYINLRVVVKTHRLESVQEFLKDYEEASEGRRFVIYDFDFSADQELSPEIERRVQNVINSFNRIGLLLEDGLLSPQLVFGICHTQLIRCWYRLEPYIRYHEGRIGGRYGRRIERLSVRAKKFHDARPQHRVTVIKIDPGVGKEPFIIYQTHIHKGVAAVKQRALWWIQRLLDLY